MNKRIIIYHNGSVRMKNQHKQITPASYCRLMRCLSGCYSTLTQRAQIYHI